MSEQEKRAALLASLPASVSPECPHFAQMLSNGLRYQEQFWHNELMSTEMSCWPESLQELVSARVKRVGLCGDVVSTAVADWIARREPMAGSRSQETPP